MCPDLALKTCVFTNSPDEHFILDGHPQVLQVFIADRFSGHGFKFTPVIGSVLADLALEGETRHSIEFLSVTRPGLLRSD